MKTITVLDEVERMSYSRAMLDPGEGANNVDSLRLTNPTAVQGVRSGLIMLGRGKTVQ
jgi:hypothetical protein